MNDYNYMTGLHCPACKQESELHVIGIVAVKLTTDDLDLLDGRFAFFPSAEAACPYCNFTETLDKFYKNADEPPPSQDISLH